MATKVIRTEQHRFLDIFDAHYQVWIDGLYVGNVFRLDKSWYATYIEPDDNNEFGTDTEFATATKNCGKYIRTRALAVSLVGEHYRRVKNGLHRRY